MTLELTSGQALIVWSLLGQQGWVMQKDLPYKVEKADREYLVEAKLISAWKVKGAFVLQLEDRGWGWAAPNLRSANLNGPYRILQAYLNRLDDHLKKTDATLADFIGTPASPPPELPEPGEKKPRIRKSTARKPSQAPAAVRKEIERAYLAVTQGRKGTDARLADVRAEIKAYDRETVDAALRRILQGDKKARLMRINDPRAISQADIEAAYAPAGEPFHLLWILE